MTIRHHATLHISSSPAQPPLDTSRLWQIHGAYYDLDPFLTAHPGGRRLLEQVRGSDCTAVFESTHLHDRTPKAMLKKFLVAENPTYAPDYSWKSDEFYATLKVRVRGHFVAQATAQGLLRADHRVAHHGTSGFIARLFGLLVPPGAANLCLVPVLHHVAGALGQRHCVTAASHPPLWPCGRGSVSRVSARS